MRKLITKILKEDEYDFIRDVAPELRKGMYLCNKHGRPFEIHGVGENWMTFYQDDVNRSTISHKINYIMSRLKSGTMTICNPLNESDEFDWVRDYDSLDGIRFTIPVMDDRTVYTIHDKGGPHVKVSFDSEKENEFNKYFKDRKQILFHRVKAEEHFWNRLWVMIPEDINESDEFDWIRDINYYKYSIGDTIEPVDGYHYYVNTIDYTKKGPISGNKEATVMNILGDFYEVKFNYNYLPKDIRKYEISYYLLIDEVDNTDPHGDKKYRWQPRTRQ